MRLSVDICRSHGYFVDHATGKVKPSNGGEHPLCDILISGVVNLPTASGLRLFRSPVVETPVRQFFHEIHLDLLDLQEFLPLVFEQDVELFMEVADF